MQDILRRFLPPAALLAALACCPGGRRTGAADPAEEQAKAEITVLVPADAEVFFDGEPTVQKGAERHFVSPPLPVGKKYHYDVVARWKEGDKTVEQTRQVEVTGGAAVRVDFLTPCREQGRTGRGRQVRRPPRPALSPRGRTQESLAAGGRPRQRSSRTTC